MSITLFPRTIRTSRTAALAGGVGLMLAALAASPASGQDALGGGNVLDNNLNAIEGPVNRPVQQQNFRSRNLLITNNVVGGRGFRGSVGYTAEADFRGELGFEEFDRFRAESAWSSVNFMNFGNTYQQIRFGEEMGLVEFRNTGQGTTAADVTPYRFQGPEQDELRARLRLEQLNFTSSMELASRSGFEPTQLGMLRDEEGEPYLVTASNLFGLKSRPATQTAGLIGLSTYDLIRAREDVTAGRLDRNIGASWDPNYRTAFLDEEERDEDGETAEREFDTVPTGRVSGPDDTRIVADRPADERISDMRRETEFDRIQERVAQSWKQMQIAESTEEGEEGDAAETDIYMDEEMVLNLDARMRELRGRLLGRSPQAAAGRPGGEDLIDRPAFGSPDEDDAERDDDYLGQIEDDPTTPIDESAVNLRTPIRVFARLLQHGERIDELATEDRTRFNELLRDGEQHLRQGEYFWAERYFNRALRFTPGHPLATAGMIHAQIGAGLYTSAALGLRSLFSYQPEMIDARYEEGLVPNDVRLRAALETLRIRLDDPADLAETALLYAYVGRLLDDQEAIRQGLEAMRKADPAGELVELLEEIWLPGADEASENAPDDAGQAEPGE